MEDEEKFLFLRSGVLRSKMTELTEIVLEFFYSIRSLFP